MHDRRKVIRPERVYQKGLIPMNITKAQVFEEDRVAFRQARVFDTLIFKRKLRDLFSETVELENQSYSSSDSEGIIAEQTESKHSQDKFKAPSLSKK